GLLARQAQGVEERRRLQEGRVRSGGGPMRPANVSRAAARPYRIRSNTVGLIMETTVFTNNAARGVAGGASTSGASGGAIFAGAAAAAALSLVLFMLGTGLGLATTSPWANHGAEASTVGITSIAWVFATQIVASALGGYLAGRLRVKWPDAQTDEIFF